MGVIQSQTFRNTIVSFAGMALGTLNILFLYRIFFSLEEFGLISFMVPLATVYSQLAALGVINVILRYFPYFKSEDKRHHGFIALSGLITVSGFLIVTLIYVIFSSQIKSAFIDNSPMFIDYYFEIILLAFFMLLFIFFESLARAIHRTVFAAFLKDVLLRALTTLGIMLVAYSVIDFREYVYYFIFINGLILILLFGQVLMSKKFVVTFKVDIPKEKVKEILKYGFYSLLSVSAFFMSLNVDRIMLGALAGLEIVGIYGIFLYVATVISFPMRSLSRIIVPILADCWKRNDTEQIKKLYKETSLILLITSLLIFMGIYVNEENLIYILNKPEFIGQFGIFIFLGLCFVIDGTGGINSDILVTSKYFRYDTVFNFIYLVAGIILNFILIPIYGGIGAAIATASAMLIFNFAKWFYIKRKFEMQPFGYKNLVVLLIAVVILVALSFMPEVKPFYLDIALKVFLVSVPFIGVIYFLKLSVELNQYIIKIFSKLIPNKT